jgi:hydrogenase expression/formation protein HypD
MKYVEEYRDPATLGRYLARIEALATEPLTIMEICGGQTHNIVKFGLDQALPDTIELIHGPGCPVCVTPAAKIDAAIAVAQRDGTLLCSFGDMLRVPGSRQSLLSAKADGASVQTVYSPLDALEIARARPELEVVFFAVGFETTAPANAMPVFLAARDGIANFSVIVSHVLVPPAMRVVLEHPDCRIQAFLAAGHVCSITGYDEYFAIARDYGIPIVVTGFEPIDILEGIARSARMVRARDFTVSNQYSRSVRRHGNRAALSMMHRVFRVTDMDWRGIGRIERSGLELADEYRGFDAERRFGLSPASSRCEPASTAPASAGAADTCRAGAILQGLIKPPECPHFGSACRPERPLGAPMVSSEGACAAYYQYAALRDTG